jgi:SAM-dependent methyltransferase
MAKSNAGPAAAGDDTAGGHRVRHAETIDAEVRAHNVHFRAAAAIAVTDEVLDVGCGTGGSTRDAARAASSGNVLGVDLSSAVLERARELSAADGLGNVSYEQADAQVHTFAPARFDVVISRFGTMFFGDPVAAFGNLRRALRPAGRLVLLVWQRGEDNEWANVVREALGKAGETTLPASPFSLGVPADVERILGESGFDDVRFTDVHEPVYYGRDADAAYSFIRGFESAKSLLASMDPLSAEHALERLYNSVLAHDTENGVLFDSRAWIVEAVTTSDRP